MKKEGKWPAVKDAKVEHQHTSDKRDGHPVKKKKWGKKN